MLRAHFLFRRADNWVTVFSHHIHSEHYPETKHNTSCGNFITSHSNKRSSSKCSVVLPNFRIKSFIKKYIYFSFPIVLRTRNYPNENNTDHQSESESSINEKNTDHQVNQNTFPKCLINSTSSEGHWEYNFRTP